ncbi:MAG: hypothetical protein M0Z53_09165 [Thermaerobacter sp.]|nr:hypothetical protein [Thermaerobacter sp.]
MGKKRRQSSIPRRKRMRRSGRLQAGKTWLARYSGKHVVKAYAKNFGVDVECAIAELQMLGHPLEAAELTRLRRDEKARIDGRRARKLVRSATPADDIGFWDLFPVGWETAVDDDAGRVGERDPARETDGEAMFPDGLWPF